MKLGLENQMWVSSTQKERNTGRQTIGSHGYAQKREGEKGKKNIQTEGGRSARKEK